jgi:hypothetical protein
VVQAAGRAAAAAAAAAQSKVCGITVSTLQLSCTYLLVLYCCAMAGCLYSQALRPSCSAWHLFVVPAQRICCNVWLPAAAPSFPCSHLARAVQGTMTLQCGEASLTWLLHGPS